MSKYPSIYAEYYDWFSVMMRGRHSAEIRAWTLEHIEFNDEDLPF
jgi:hypothetical protein